MHGPNVYIQSSTVFAGFLLLFCMIFASSVPAYGQVDLDRISVAERSDGQGFVVRYHMSESVDSFKVIQPEVDLVQMIFYSEEIDTSGIHVPESSESIQNIHLYGLPDGYGIDVELGTEEYFHANAYFDKNGRDILLGLTRTGYEEITRLTDGINPILWSRFSMENLPGDRDNLLGNVLDQEDNYYQRTRENYNFDTVVIDAGHGGRDPGTIGYRGTREKDVTLAIALKLGEYIEQNLPDVKVIYTRNEDRFLELEERGWIANKARGDLFVSIHANAYANPRVNGSEVYFLGLAKSQSALEVMKRENSVVELESGNGLEELTEEDLLIYELANVGNISLSEKIAEKMEYQFRERAQRNSRGVKQAQFVVLYHASMPALLVEAGFITNPAEAKFLTSEYGQAIVASAIFRAIRDYKTEFERSNNITRSE